MRPYFFTKFLHACSSLVTAEKLGLKLFHHFVKEIMHFLYV